MGLLGDPVKFVRDFLTVVLMIAYVFAFGTAFLEKLRHGGFRTSDLDDILKASLRYFAKFIWHAALVTTLSYAFKFFLDFIEHFYPKLSELLKRA